MEHEAQPTPDTLIALRVGTAQWLTVKPPPRDKVRRQPTQEPGA